MSDATTRGRPFRKVLFCTDFSTNADFAFDYAVAEAVRWPDCTLYLLHVIPEPDAQFWKTYIYEVDDVDQQAKKDIDARIEQVYLPRVPEGLDFEVVHLIGHDYQRILEFADEKDIDLIVMGRQGRSSLGKWLFGEITEKVTRKARCAVLVIPLSYERRVEE